MSAIPTRLTATWPGLRSAWIGERFMGWLRAQASGAQLSALVDGLAAIGERIHALIRAPWSARRAPASPAADERALALWRAWEGGDFWTIQTRWEAAYLLDGARAFLAVAEAANQRPRLRLDVMESFFQVCWDAHGGAPGWRKIRARIAEAEGPSPCASLVRGLPADERAQWIAGLFSWGARAESAAILLPEVVGAATRARTLATRLEATDALDDLVDVHVAIRLVQVWRSADTLDPELGWRVVLQNHGRARGRLRARLAARPELPAPIVSGLHARTRYAVRRFFRDWARAQRPDFPLGDAFAVDPARPTAGHRPFEPDERAALRGWILLGVLRGHLGSLRAWRDARRPTGRVAAFYRFLNELPPTLRAPQAGDRAGRERVRVELVEALDPLLTDLHPVLTRVAALRGPGLADRLRATLAADWHPAVPRPRGRTHTYVEHAARAARHIAEEPS